MKLRCSAAKRVTRAWFEFPRFFAVPAWTVADLTRKRLTVGDHLVHCPRSFASQSATGGSTVADLLARKRLTIGDHLIHSDETLESSLKRLADLSLSSLLVVEGDGGRVVGLVTAHDVLRELTRRGDAASALRLPVSAAMTPSSRLVHVSPTDSLQAAAATMAELHVTHLPCVHAGFVQGIVTLGDVADVLARRGGKEAAVSIVTHRGISEGTRAALGVGGASPPARPPSYTDEASSLYLRTGVAAAPRAPKRGLEKASEDSYFTLHLAWPGVGVGQPPTPVTYLGVADGVGSWWQHGVDPRLYANALMEECAAAVWDAAVHHGDPPSPHDVLTQAWKRVAARRVVGSATAVVVFLDPLRRALVMHGVGDCGVVLLRDTDVNRVGSLLRGGVANAMRGGFRVSARATQQLTRFNMPYQLGYSPDPAHGVFQSPGDGETLALPVRSEDIVLAATDGLYDNLDETDVLAEVEAWDAVDLPRRQAYRRAQEAGHVASQAFDARPTTRAPRLLDGCSEGVETLALSLTRRARELSVDRMRDGPFARLAKENDILWTQGGRPDDVTTLVARVSDKGPLEVGPRRAGGGPWAGLHPLRVPSVGGRPGGVGIASSDGPYAHPATLEARLRGLVPTDGARGIVMQ